MPGQRLREVRAIGKAYANSDPDTARMISTERDWMRGDSVIAQFDSIAPGDTVSKPQAKKIIANGNASSFYQLAQNGKAKGPPNLNYVRGRIITVSFQNKTVDKVDVVDQASGVYLEANAKPAQDTAAAQRPPRRRSP